MYFIKYFYTKTLKYDLINKFTYKTPIEIPKIKKIILNIGCETATMKRLAANLLALELIANQEGFPTKSKTMVVRLKIKKGTPTGCKVTLQKRKMLYFFFKNIAFITPKRKDFMGFKILKKTKNNVFSYELSDIFSFNELEKKYELFNDLSKLSVTIITNCKVKTELIFLLKSLQFPILSVNDLLKVDITQLVECDLAKVKVKGSNLFIC